MRKTTFCAATALVYGMTVLGLAHAQQTSPAQSTPSTTSSGKSSQNPAAKPAATQAAKPGTSSATAKKSTPAPLILKTEKDKASYAYGLNMGKGMHRDSVDLDPAIFYRGMKDGLAGGKTLLTDDEARAVITAFQTELRKQQQERMQVLGEANKKAGEAFLAENKAKPDVVTTASGLQYKILQEGTGPKPAASDVVVCNYRGTLLDNTEFDGSAKHGQPLTIQVNGVIRGWTEALQLMPVGSKWQLFVPSDLAYGVRGQPGANIGPNATLVFEIELLSIRPKPSAPTPAPAPGANPSPNANPPATPNPAAAPNPVPAPPPSPDPAAPPKPTPTPTPTLSPNPSATAMLNASPTFLTYRRTER